MTVYEKVEEQKFIKIKIKNMMDILKKINMMDQENIIIQMAI